MSGGEYAPSLCSSLQQETQSDSLRLQKQSLGASTLLPSAAPFSMKNNAVRAGGLQKQSLGASTQLLSAASYSMKNKAIR